jgi:hypothetical protein
MYFFMQKTERCPDFMRFAMGIRVFSRETVHLVAPQLENFLNGGVIFCPAVHLAVPSSFDLPELYATGRVVRDCDIKLGSLDCHSSVTFSTRIRKVSDAAAFFFQCSFDAVRPDGFRVLRVLSFSFRATPSVDRFDAITFAGLLARQIGRCAYVESIRDAYRQHRENCHGYIALWSDTQQYLRSIPEIFRDVPLLLFGIQLSDLFSRAATRSEQMGAVLRFMGTSVEYLRRELYPVMIIPPFNFPHRLQRAVLRNARLVIFVRAFDAVAISLGDEVDEEQIRQVAEAFAVPMTVHRDPERLDDFLIEDQSVTWPGFAEDLEVEINGEWF